MSSPSSSAFALSPHHERRMAEVRALARGVLALQGLGAHPIAVAGGEAVAAFALSEPAASRYDSGAEGVTGLAAMAKLYATESAQWVVDAAVQVHGARALVRGHLLERLYREVRAPRIYEGTSEIQRTVIARELFKRTGEP